MKDVVNCWNLGKPSGREDERYSRPRAIVIGWCVRRIYIDPNAYWLHQTRATGCRSFVFPFYWVYSIAKCHRDDEVMWRCISMTRTAFTGHLSIRSQEEEKNTLANHCSCHHVPSHSFLQAGRHFISWLYSLWVGSSPHSSVIAMLKMAHPSHWGLARAINRRAPQRGNCLWAGTAQNRLFADVAFYALPSHWKVSTRKLQILFWCCKRVVQHAWEKKMGIIIFCFMNPRNNLNNSLN